MAHTHDDHGHDHDRKAHDHGTHDHGAHDHGSHAPHNDGHKHGGHAHGHGHSHAAEIVTRGNFGQFETLFVVVERGDETVVHRVDRVSDEELTLRGFYLDFGFD